MDSDGDDDDLLDEVDDDHYDEDNKQMSQCQTHLSPLFSHLMTLPLPVKSPSNFVNAPS